MNVPAIKPATAPAFTSQSLASLMPQSLDDAFRLAKALSMAGEMVPKHFHGKPEATMAAILRGLEIGLAPMQALSHIAVINGRASLWGDAIPALMQRHGHHVDVEVTGDGDNMAATATLERGDTGRTYVRTFTVADAKKAGLWAKQGPWQQYPKRMLALRARTLAVRDGAADALMGLQIAEEVQDYPRDVTPPVNSVVARLAKSATPARDIVDHVNAETGEITEPNTDTEHEFQAADLEPGAMADPPIIDTAPEADGGAGPIPVEPAPPSAPISLTTDDAAIVRRWHSLMSRCEQKENVDKAVTKLRGNMSEADHERLKTRLQTVYRAHLARVRGESDMEACTAIIDQITGGA